ncbi:hypothetical protein [Tissierella sp. P1]|uniref:hypothetical protein n=1 Tax=Tissierella sp. P1 TaxID=1280483 RepID=UPI001F36DBE5|nr:hypothetical protein [Tissierella sp. P1]
MLIIVIIIGIMALVFIANRSKYFLHMLQLEGYNSEQFQKWINSNKEKSFFSKK